MGVFRFRIDGTVKGTIVSEQELIVGDAGTVEGEIRVWRLAVSGTIRGVVFARERIEILGGTLTLDSAPGEGTHVAFTVPVPKEEPARAAH